MANQDRFKKIGSFLGETLDKATNKISDAVENFDKEEFKENVSDFSKKVVDTASKKYDEAVGEDKFCAVCGKKLGIIGKRKIADGTLCNQCSSVFKQISESEGFALSQKSSAELIEIKKVYDEKQKKTTTMILIGCAIALALCFGFLNMKATAERKAHENQVDVSSIKYALKTETYETIEQKFRDAGFTNIEYSVSEDLPQNKSAQVGVVDKIEINGDSNIKNMEWVDKDAVITLYYHVLAPVEEKPESNTSSSTNSSSNNNNSSSNTASSSNQTQGYANYTTNDKDHYKKGNSGKYSYVMQGTRYDIYLIIDFDEGYVYRFLEGDGNTDCDKVEITSGTLNDVVIITYHEGGTTWQNGLSFKYANQPDHLVFEDDDHFTYDFYTTDLSKAISLKNKKNIIKY